MEQDAKGMAAAQMQLAKLEQHMAREHPPRKATSYDIARLANRLHANHHIGYRGSEQEQQFCKDWNLRPVSARAA